MTATLSESHVTAPVVYLLPPRFFLQEKINRRVVMEKNKIRNASSPPIILANETANQLSSRMDSKRKYAKDFFLNWKSSLERFDILTAEM